MSQILYRRAKQRREEKATPRKQMKYLKSIAESLESIAHDIDYIKNHKL